VPAVCWRTVLLANCTQYSRLGMKESVDATYWIEKLGLEVHPEGGYFRQTYKSELRIVPEASGRTGRTHAVAKPPTTVAQPGPHGSRAASTGIYFLLEGKNFSAFHRLRSDEMWHFYAGSPLLVHVLDPAGGYSSILLGGDADAGQVFQAVVRAGDWFGAELAQNPHCQNPGEREYPSYALVGCTVAPGFEFEDFEMASRQELEAKYPGQKDIIQKLTRS
jgi:uncharacterized protein